MNIMNLIEQYSMRIIDPLEDRIHYLENEIYKKTNSEITIEEKTMLRKMNMELIKYYEKFAKFVNKEMKDGKGF